MHPIRIGRIVRTLRRRRAWRQIDLAHRARVSQQAVSLIETGQSRRVSIHLLERVLGAMEAEVELVVRWRGGEIDRILDEAHAALVGETARRLAAAGWSVRAEVTYAIGRERGSIDLLAFRADPGALLVIEVKSDFTSAEATLRKHDEKSRLGTSIARERLDWNARSVSRLLVLPESSTARRRVESHGELLSRVYPLRGWALTAWLEHPAQASGGLMFLSPTSLRGLRRDLTSRRRIRLAE